MFITKTRCMRGWPLVYQTYYQQTEYPFKHADRTYVLRFFRIGIVIGKWSRRMPDEDSANLAALGAKPTPLLDAEGALLPHFQPETQECHQ
jgi:hypothetical protein